MVLTQENVWTRWRTKAIAETVIVLTLTIMDCFVGWLMM
jgi:hypothetical protein